MKIAPINKIIKSSFVDGVGNRCTIFFQGCNINCIYCHNPETQNLCNDCRSCMEFCESGALSVVDSKINWNKLLCVDCDKCLTNCKNNSSPKVTWMSVEEVVDEVKKCMPFIRGITVSGGECMLYPEFVTDLFYQCKNMGLDCLIDSNGTLPIWDLELCKLCDGVMLDIKACSLERFFDLTQGDNYNVWENLKELYKRGKIEELRIVCLEDYVDYYDILDKTWDIIKNNNEIKIKLIKFRQHGCKNHNLESPNDEIMNNIFNYACKLGFTKVSIT